MTRSFFVAAAVLALGLAPVPPEKLSFVDLQPKSNHKLDEDSGRGIEGNNLGSVPQGEQPLGGVQFHVGKAMLQLGSPLLKNPRPDKVEGIKVGKPFAKLHILQATYFGNGGVIGQPGQPGDPLFIADDTRIAEYKLHFDDRSTETVPVVYGQDVRDFWYTDNSKGVTRGKVAWTGENKASQQFGSRIRVYATTWDNPKPDKKVETIDFIRAPGTPAAPFCLAITIESK